MKNHYSSFDMYGFKHLCHHLISAGYWEKLIEILSDYGFVESMVNAGLKFDLMRDYKTAQRSISSDDLTPGDIARLNDWQSFVSSSIHRLASSGEPFLQLAYNNSASGHVADSSENYMEYYQKPWLRLRNRPRTANSAKSLTFTGHSGTIRNVVVLSDGNRVVSTSDDGTMRVWDLISGDCLLIQQHGSGASELVSIPHTELIVSGGADGILRVWSLKDNAGICLREMEGHLGRIEGLDVTEDGCTIVSAGYDHSIRLWDVKGGKCLKVLKSYDRDTTFAIAITPDGSKILSGGRNGDGWIRFWDSSKGDCYKKMKTDFYIYDIAITSVDHLAISASSRLQIWDIETGKCIRELKKNGEKVYAEFLELLPDQRYLISGWRNTLQVWDLETGMCEQEIDITSWANSLAITPNGRYMIFGGRDWKLKLWDLENVTNMIDRPRHKREVTSIVISPQSVMVSGDYLGEMRIWSENGNCIHTIQCGTGNERVSHLTITPDNQCVVAATSKSLGVWNLKNGKCRWLCKTNDLRAIALVPDKQIVISSGWEKSAKLYLWNLNTGKKLSEYSLRNENNSVDSIIVVPNSRYVVTVGTWASRLWDIANRGWMREIRSIKGRAQMLTQDGKEVIGHSASHVFTWNLWSGKHSNIIKSHERGRIAIAILEDAYSLLSGGQDGILYLWNLSSGECMQIMRGHTSFITQISVTPDGRRAISGSWDKSIRIWDLTNGQEIACFISEVNNEEATPRFVLSPDERKLVVGEGSGVVNIFDLIGFD